jgi:putative transposase
MARPHRLDRNCYIGVQCHFVTACTRDRQKAFVANDFCALAVRQLLARAFHHRFTIPAYCLMPDHAHVVLRGRSATVDLSRLIAAWRQDTGFSWSLRSGRRLWQRGCWDRTLRADDDLLPIARYVLENPVRAGLVADPRDYPWSGSNEYTIEEILDAVQIDLWSKWSR